MAFPSFFELRKNPHHISPAAGIQSRCRLIQQYNLWIINNSCCYTQALSHTSRHCGYLIFFQKGQQAAAAYSFSLDFYPSANNLNTHRLSNIQKISRQVRKISNFNNMVVWINNFTRQICTCSAVCRRQTSHNIHQRCLTCAQFFSNQAVYFAPFLQKTKHLLIRHDRQKSFFHLINYDHSSHHPALL